MNFFHILFYSEQDIDIVVGTYQWNSGGSRYHLKESLIHELYGGPLPGYDIGLVKVQGEFEFNEKVQPIKYSTKKVPAGTQLQTFGWGRQSVSFTNFCPS